MVGRTGRGGLGLPNVMRFSCGGKRKAAITLVDESRRSRGVQGTLGTTLLS
jgi:hypothetical protein